MQFLVGERVKVAVDADNLKKLQDGHGGWNPKMVQVFTVFFDTLKALVSDIFFSKSSLF